MKNKILGGIAILAIAAVAAFNVNFNAQSGDLAVVSLADIEALAQEELTHCPNFRSQNVWIPSGWISGSWYTCCGMGADIDACAFSLESSECKQWASRPSKPSNCL